MKFLQAYARRLRCEGGWLRGGALWPSLYLVSLTLYWYQPWNGHVITGFDRVMGQATAAGVRVGGRTGAALLTLLVLLPGLAFLYGNLVSLCLGEKKGAPGVAHGPVLAGFINACSGMGLVLMALRYAQRFGGENKNWLTDAQALPLALTVCLLLWCGFRRALPARVQTVSAQGVLRALLCALPVSFVLDMACGWGLYAAAQYGALCLAVLAVAMLLTPLWQRLAPQRAAALVPALRAAGLPLLLCLPLTLLYLEATQLLTQYGVTPPPRLLPVRLLLAACFVGAAVTAVLVGRKHSTATATNGAAATKAANPAKGTAPAKAAAKPPKGALAARPAAGGDCGWKKLWYPLLLVGLALLAAQPELQICVESDFFERANSAVSISGFLRFGQIPAVETHGAHMVSDYAGGILWGLLNGDALSASFTSYGGIPLALTTLVFYGLLALCVGQDAAFAAALLLPVTNIAPGDWYAHLSYLPVLVLPWLVQKRGFGRYAAFWGAAAFSVLYRGDIGLAVGLAAVVVVLVDAACQKSARGWKNLGLAFLAVGGGLAAVLALLCLARGIDPLARLWEFLQLMAFSNQNWAYEGLGLAGTAGFVWVYLVVPVLLLALLAVLLRRDAGALRAGHWLFFTFTGGYFLNFVRTLVRHSLVENIPVYCVSVGMWALALGVWLLWRGHDGQKSGRVALPCLLVLSILVSGALFDGRVQAGTPLLQRSYDTFQEGAILDYQLAEPDGSTQRVTQPQLPVQRVVLSQQIQAASRPLRAEIDRLLQEDETYLDFTNQSALYAILGRPNPVYVNQSPGLLNGEYTQEKFIQQVEAQSDKVPLALLPKGNMALAFILDGVQNSMRYYRVAEYIYNNYVPYETVGNFAIWLRQDRAEAIEALPAAVADELPVDYSLVQGHNVTLRPQQDSLTVQATGEDPQLDRLERLVPAGSNNGLVNLTVRYTSDTAGQVQLFYAPANRNFEEESSVRLAVQQTQQPQTITFTFPYNTTYRLRLDPPDGATFVIHGLSTGQSVADRCGYDYAAYGDAHVYQLGQIPLLWGEADLANAAQNPPTVPGLTKLSNGYDVPAAARGGAQGRYVCLRIAAKEAGTAAVHLVDRNKGGVQLASFLFDVEPGEHTYLVRVSADCLWYSKLVDTIRVATEGVGLVVQDVTLLDGD